ncbi:MAG: HAD-IA family hydrolase [Clostridiales bacterium]|jgi:HAD superfamily hydrolase (TIGR01509 family)|nr:HAD-IA family hydrolase [Clostridiales bacterium]
MRASKIFGGADGVIFDMDGVLCDSQPFHFESDARTLAIFGAVADAAGVAAYAGMASENRWNKFIADFGLAASPADLIAAHDRIKAEMLERVIFEPTRGSRELIAALREDGARLALASSSSYSFIGRMLENIGLAGAFDAVISGEGLTRGKPFPDIFLLAAGRIGVPPERCAVVEDSANGVRAAKSAGMFCVGYQNPTSGAQDLSAADIIVKDFMELIR